MTFFNLCGSIDIRDSTKFTMQVQKVKVRGQTTWILIGKDYLPIDPVTDYLQHLTALSKSPNTIKNYAHHLKLFWEFLEAYSLDWTECWEKELGEFMLWLQLPDSIPGVVSIQPQTAKRTERTINTIMSVVYQFYEFHARNSAIESRNLYKTTYPIERRYKPLLYEMKKDKGVKTKRLRVKEPRKFIECLTREEVNALIEACPNTRDKFLIVLLYHTGMRIGEALGLRHEDIHSEMGLDEIHVIPRNDNINLARVKSAKQRNLSVPTQTIQAYTNYVLDDEFPDVDSDYVFVNIWQGVSGSPMQYSTVQRLFQTLQRRTKIKVTAHIFRHTHATELIRAGMNLIYVQQRLGHASVQTTIDTYVHLVDEDKKAAYKDYLSKAEQG